MKKLALLIPTWEIIENIYNSYSSKVSYFNALIKLWEKMNSCCDENIFKEMCLNIVK